MERPPERPWRDYEKLELFANIIRASDINPDELFRFIAQHQIAPSWDNTVLPHERTKAECERQFEYYRRRAPYQPRSSFSGPTSQFPLPPVSYGGPGIRGFDPQMSGGRILLPKTAPSTPSEIVLAYPQSPMTEAPVARKRGRPPKEEVSRRRAEAELRGEPYPPPRSKRRNRTSGTQEAPSPLSMTPYTAPAPSAPITTPTGAAPAETGSESSGSKRRRLRPADIETGGTRPESASYGSPPQTSFTQAQPSASMTSGGDDTDVRMEGVEENAPPSRSQSYHHIVGITRSSA